MAHIATLITYVLRVVLYLTNNILKQEIKYTYVCALSDSSAEKSKMMKLATKTLMSNGYHKGHLNDIA